MELRAAIERVSGKYVNEFEATAYALMNAISDLATHLPSDYPFAQGGFVRRGRHSLQLLAAHWLREFSLRAASPGFELGKYVQQLLGESGTEEWQGYR